MLLANATSFQPASLALTKLTIPLLPLPDSSLEPGQTPYYPPLSRCGSAVPQNPYPQGSPVSTNALAVLVDAFVRAAVVSSTETEDGGKIVVRGDPKRKADLHFLASVFVNVSGVSFHVRYILREMIFLYNILVPEVGFIFSSQTQPGRDFFLTPIPSLPLAPSPPFEYPLSKLTAFTEHTSNIRRKGVGATIRYVSSFKRLHTLS